MAWRKSILTTFFIGNDVVDLAEANIGVGDHRQRFVSRICTPEEQSLVANSRNPNRTLWAIWAAKETAFKIALRQNVHTAFIKHEFLVNDAPDSDTDFQSFVLFQDMAIKVRWMMTQDFIHCVGGWSEYDMYPNDITASVCLEDEASLSTITLTEREQRSVRSDTSMKVRQFAKQLLIEKGLDDIEVIREQEPERWRAPRLWRGDRELHNSGVSLSHHGRFLAVAMWLPS